MYKVILLLFSVLFANASDAQVTYSNYLDSTSQWRYYGDAVDMINSYINYQTVFFDGYETIDGIDYYKEYSNNISIVSDFSSSIPDTTYNIYGPLYVREDSLGNFYRIYPNNQPESLFFNNQSIINSQLGEIFPYEGSVCTVDSIEYLFLENRILKRVNGINILNNFFPSGSLEGVGVIGLACAIGIHGNGYLNSYTKQGIMLQFGDLDSSLFPPALRMGLFTNTNEVGENEISIFPNPTQGTFKLVSDFYSSLNSFEIYDIRGIMLRKEVIFEKEQNIDITSFDKGIYYLKIVNGSKVTFKKISKL